jgi:hypothetical protein
MTNRVPASLIESIVDRLTVGAEQTVYILHSRECVARYDDLRDCPWSLALDNGIGRTCEWVEDVAVKVRVRDGEWVPGAMAPLLDADSGEVSGE